MCKTRAQSATDQRSFQIKEDDYEKIRDFVQKRKEDHVLYVKRGGFREEDIWVGAMAEFAAYYYLQERGEECSAPDLNIYTSKEKSYDADLRSNRRFFHVKGQSLRSQKLYGDSWLVQRYDKIAQKEIKSHYFILCTVDIENREVIIKGTPSTSSIHKHELFGECKHPAFRRTKRALYLNQICDKLNNKQLWRV